MEAPTIHEAAAAGNVDAVRQMLDRDPSLVDADDQHQWRPLFHAGLYRQLEAVRLLIDRGADVTAHDGYAMHYAGQVPGNKAIIELLILHGALDAHVHPPTHLYRQFLTAVFLANESRVRYLLTQHPHLATTWEGRGDQPLHHACRNGDLAIIAHLVEGGADVNAHSRSGHFPLYCAGGHGHVEAARYLLDRGADLQAKLPDGHTFRAWVEQFADDPRFRNVIAMLDSYA